MSRSFPVLLMGLGLTTTANVGCSPSPNAAADLCEEFLDLVVECEGEVREGTPDCGDVSNTPGSVAFFTCFVETATCTDGTLGGDGSCSESPCPMLQFPVGDFPTSVALADLDGDGDVDLVTANAGSDDISVLLNNGDGTFGAQLLVPTGENPSMVTTSDFDGDGDIDLAITNREGGSVSILLNHGNGTFADQSLFDVPRPTSLTAADLNGDGNVDLAMTFSTSTSQWPGSVNVLHNNGDGTFAYPKVSSYATAPSPKSITSADFDGDDRIDLAVVGPLSLDMSLFLTGQAPPNNDLAFGTISIRIGGLSPTSVTSADLDGDGDIDLAIVTSTGPNFSAEGHLWVKLNNGDGTFTSSFDAVVAIGSRSNSVTAADLDGDGDIDLAIANAFRSGPPSCSNGTASVVLNNGDGTFAASSNFPAGIEPVSIAAADLDGDGDIDLAIANITGHTVSILLNEGDATFTSE